MARALPRLVGMVHLRPLPGSPGFSSSMDSVIAAAVRDATTLRDAGFDGVMIENIGDAPFFADDVPKVTVAAMTRATAAVNDVGLPVGVNVLRNDALAALAVAAACEAAMIRVNVLAGTMYTDQGPIIGRAAEVARARSSLCPSTAILADVFVKHATPPPGLTLEQAARDLAERGSPDAIVVSGSATGFPVAEGDVKTVKAETHLPVYVGSGVTPESVAGLLEVADGVIVGSSLKVGGAIAAPIDPALASALVASAPA